MSLRKKHGRSKFCHWFMYNWNGYAWHSKSGMWVQDRKFNRRKWGYNGNEEAMAKGCPQHLVEEFITIPFHGIDIRIPLRFGELLDFLYPGWKIPAKGSSSKTVVAIITKWKSKKNWRIVVN